MAKNTSTAKPFEAGDSNARAVRRPSADAPAVPQTPQRDAKARATTAGDDAPGKAAEPIAPASDPPPAADAPLPKPAKAAKAAKAPAKKRR